MKKWWPFLILPIILILIRSINLLSLPLYLDEGIYLFWAKLYSGDPGYAYVSLQDGKTPLFMWLVSFFNEHVDNSLLSGRLISAIAGGVTALSWMIIVYKIFRYKTTLLFWLIFLVVPYSFLYERLAFVDGLLTAFGSLGLLFLFLGKERLKNHNWWQMIFWGLLSGTALGLAYMTKPTAKIFLYSQILIIFYWAVIYLNRKEYLNILGLLLGVASMFFIYQEILGFLRFGGYRFWDQIGNREVTYIMSLSEYKELLTTNISALFNLYIKHGLLILQYILYYLGGIFLLFLVGIKEIISKNKSAIWILLYIGFITSTMFIFGIQMASRYYYLIIPAVVAVSSLGALKLFETKSQGSKRLVIVILLLCFINSALIVFTPFNSLLASDDKSYFVTSDLTAYGLGEVTKLLETNAKNSVVGVVGIWGVAEGSQVLLEQKGVEVYKIDRIFNYSNLGKGEKCEGVMESKIECSKINIDQIKKSPRPNKYLLLFDKSVNLDKIRAQQPFTIEKEFMRPQSTYKVYLLKLS